MDPVRATHGRLRRLCRRSAQQDKHLGELRRKVAAVAGKRNQALRRLQAVRGGEH